MTFRINFSVPGQPVPKQRARVTSQGTYYAPRPRGSTRLSYLEYRELVQAEAMKALANLQGDDLRYWNEEWGGRPRVWHEGDMGISIKARLGAGDADNVLGSILDALQGILWENDKQVLQASVLLERVPAKAPRGVEVECFVLEE